MTKRCGGADLRRARGADDDDGDLAQIGVVLALLQDVPAGEDGHHEVEHDDGGVLRAHDVERVPAVRRLGELIPIAPQRRNDHLADVRVVVDDQDRLDHWGCRGSLVHDPQTQWSNLSWSSMTTRTSAR